MTKIGEAIVLKTIPGKWIIWFTKITHDYGGTTNET